MTRQVVDLDSKGGNAGLLQSVWPQLGGHLVVRSYPEPFGQDLQPAGTEPDGVVDARGETDGIEFLGGSNTSGGLLWGAARVGLQLAVCQYLDLVGEAFGNKFTPLRYGLRLTAQCLCQFVSPTEVVNYVFFFITLHLVRFIFESKCKVC